MEADEKSWLAAAQRAMEIEAAAVAKAGRRLDGSLLQAVALILPHRGKVVVTGLGKSGHVARKLVATLCSTGTPAVFLHAAEASHGDVGLYQPGDPTLMISKSGNTRELRELIPFLREMHSARIGILGNPGSPLAREMDVVLDSSVDCEADADNVAPTASATVASALGDALAVALMHARGVGADEVGRRHPGGHLGRSLRLRVADVMHSSDDVAWVAPQDALKQVVIAMTHHPHGAACVVDPAHRLAGIVTDGDVRRALQAHDDIRVLRAVEVMTASPVTVDPQARLLDALRLMEERPSQISVLPVVDSSSGVCLGLLRLHDIYRAGLE